MTGTLYLVGVGPGDPELLTLKAVRLLDAVPVVAYPDPGGETALALRIAQIHISPHATLLPIPLPMRVEREAGQAAYDGGARALGEHLRAGRDVAYLCEGDPLFYGSAMYLIGRLGAEFPVKIIPGVTSLTAAAAAIGRPLAARNEVLKVVPGPLPDDVLRAELDGAEAVAIIKVGRHFGRIRAVLEATGHANGATVVTHASTGREQVRPLADCQRAELPYFSMILCYRGAEDWRR